MKVELLNSKLRETQLISGNLKLPKKNEKNPYKFLFLLILGSIFDFFCSNFVRKAEEGNSRARQGAPMPFGEISWDNFSSPPPQKK